jgi:hypothetical protein
MALLDDRLESVAADLEPVGRPVMFFGAGILHRYLDVPEVLAEPLRPTEDVDVLLHVTVQASSYEAARAVEAALQACGWRPDMRSHRRSIHAYVSPGDIAVDIAVDTLFPAHDWAVVAQDTAEDHTLPSGRLIRIPSPALFLVCKLEASRNPKRWEGPYEIHDLEDVAQLIAGSSRLRDSIVACPPAARRWLREWADDVLAGSTFGDQTSACLEGNWPRGVDLSKLDTFLDGLSQLDPD